MTMTILTWKDGGSCSGKEFGAKTIRNKMTNEIKFQHMTHHCLFIYLLALFFWQTNHFGR